MVRTALIAFLATWFGSVAWAETARIATWNLGGFHQIPESKLAEIVRGLEQLDADIVVLPELNPLSHAQEIADRLSQPADKCYQAVATDQPKASQEIGFVFRCDVDVSNPGLVVGSDLGNQGYRNAAVVYAKIGQFDFVLIGLHLKAGRGSTNRALRDEQLKFISGYVQGVVMAGEKDVLVIGDYNMIPVEDADNFDTLNVDGSLRFVSSEDLAGGFSYISSGNPGNLLDGYAFTNIDENEYQNGSVEIVQMHTLLGFSLTDYASQVTDHLPVVAEFNTDVDHD